MPKKILTHARVRELLDYNPYTGDLRWKVRRGGTANAGTFAATLETHSKTGYQRYRVQIDCKSYTASRIIWLWMTGEFPKHQIDHEDQDSLNNKWDNLRDIPNQQNHKNRHKQRNNIRGAMGVSKRKDCNTYRARIMVDGINIELGGFNNKADAIKARKAAEKRYGFHPNHGRERSAA